MANPPRRFSAPDTTSAVIGDFQEPYGAVVFPAPVSSAAEDIADKEETQRSRLIRNGQWLRERVERIVEKVVQRDMADAILVVIIRRIVLDGLHRLGFCMGFSGYNSENCFGSRYLTTVVEACWDSMCLNGQNPSTLDTDSLRKIQLCDLIPFYQLQHFFRLPTDIDKDSFINYLILNMDKIF
jgi:hypothetical protein